VEKKLAEYFFFGKLQQDKQDCNNTTEATVIHPREGIEFTL
jgi:hypothetical protein